jgi:uncharacterized membrane protein YGL010W
VPSAFGALSPWLNWATLFLLAAIVYYLSLSPRLALGMLIFSLLVVWLTLGLAALPGPLWAASLAIFVGAWIGQFVGHRIEGRKPSFFKDLQFLLIGPLWLLAHLYRQVGLRY